jgi:NADH-quinone oxidoreductase subunit A
MQYAVLPVFLFVACAIGLAVGVLILASLFNPARPNRVISMPYESGMDPIHDTRRRFDVRFHLLAIAFLVFDVEMLFLYPWAVAAGSDHKEARAGAPSHQQGMGTSVPIDSVLPNKPLKNAVEGDSSRRRSGESPEIRRQESPPTRMNRHTVFAGAMTFLALLAAGYVYDWRKGIFRWR